MYLEELTDTVPESDNTTQTDAFMDRPPTPLFVPQKTGMDAATQIEKGMRVKQQKILGHPRNIQGYKIFLSDVAWFPVIHMAGGCQHLWRYGSLLSGEPQASQLGVVTSG